ncbi:hypothetical protein WUBG_05785 [Wuchereria bancrofti]|uniref:Uncharacterized protein n=1 Tax=Wuchereria bancrofti TaxID=6293 RepID=J9F7G7_WUCBA|nr:hypothetical protein WUBG_05785 [Wuchereria bancrofti]
MREILSNDNNDYSKHILSDKTSLSTSNTPPLQSMLSLFEPCGRSNSTSSMPSISVTSFVTSTGRHRLLPQTPDEHIRRSSSPRLLPTPPLSFQSVSPLLSLSSKSTTTTASDLSVYHNWNLDQRSIITGRPVKQQYSTTTTVNNDNNVNDDDNTDNIADNEWPLPTVIQRKFSELQKVSQNDCSNSSSEHITYDTSLRSLQRLSSLKQQQQQQQQKHKQQQQQQQEGGEGGKFNQPQYSLDHSSGTSTSTNAYSQSSSLSPSVEQV